MTVRRVTRFLAAIVAGSILASPCLAQGYGPRPVEAQAVLMRQIWAKEKQADIKVVQRVYSRTVGFSLPRPFVPGYLAEAPGSYLAEYVPDGQSVEKWTRMVTVSGRLGGGAAHLDDSELAAAVFDNLSCADKVYRDLGSTAAAVVGYRLLVIGCGAAGAAGSERGLIAMFRDGENMWTVQYAARGAMTGDFETRARTEVARLAPFVTCKDGETAPACAARAK